MDLLAARGSSGVNGSDGWAAVMDKGFVLSGRAVKKRSEKGIKISDQKQRTYSGRMVLRAAGGRGHSGPPRARAPMGQPRAPVGTRELALRRRSVPSVLRAAQGVAGEWRV